MSHCIHCGNSIPDLARTCKEAGYSEDCTLVTETSGNEYAKKANEIGYPMHQLSMHVWELACRRYGYGGNAQASEMYRKIMSLVFDEFGGTKDCDWCEGIGIRTVSVEQENGMGELAHETCGVCKGVGKVRKS